MDPSVNHSDHENDSEFWLENEKNISNGEMEGNDERNLAKLFLLIISAITVSGNLLVVASVCRERTLQTATNYLIISLAVADLLVALCVMPFAVYVEIENGVWSLPKSLCTCYIAIDVCASTASILNLVAISWDRYMAVSRPIEYAQSRRLKNRRVLVMIIGVWSISIVIALPMLTGLNRLDDTKYCEFTNALYILISSFASFFLPCILIVVLYSVVLRKLRRRRVQRKKGSRNSPYSSKNGKLRTSYRNSGTTNNETTTNNEISVGTRDDRGSQGGLEAEHDRVTIFSSTPEIRNRKMVDGGSISESPVQLITGSTGLTVPALSVRGNSQYSDQSGLKRVNGLESGTLTVGSWTTYNNNIISLVENCVHMASDDNVHQIPFHLNIDMESMPFIDASSCQATPLHTKKSSSHQDANGTGRWLGTSVSRSCSVAPIGERSNWMTVIDQPPMPSPPATPAHSRRHSMASFISAPFASLGGRFRDRACLSEMLDGRRRQAAPNSGTKYTRQSRKERRATQTLAIVLVVFLCCWLPFFTCHVTNSICMVWSGDTCINIAAFFFTTWLGYTNSFMNPIIYTIWNPEYRRAFKNILSCQRLMPGQR